MHSLQMIRKKDFSPEGPPSTWAMIASMGLLIGWLASAMLYFNLSTIYTLLVALCLLVGTGLWQKQRWSVLEETMIEGLSKAVPLMVMLLMVGMLVPVWIVGGTIPTTLYYALNYLSPQWFFVGCVLIAMVVSSFTGSSVTTVSTIGVVLMGVAKLMQIHEGMTAGAIICGACFGDKCSPLSDTTNLAPSVAAVPLMVHVRHLLRTAFPATLITLLLFAFLGRSCAPLDHLHMHKIEEIKTCLSAHFNLSCWTLIPPLGMILLAYKRISSFLSFAFGIFSSLLLTLFHGGMGALNGLSSLLKEGYVFAGDQKEMKALLNKGGIDTVLEVMLLVGIAFAFGALWQKIGLTRFLMQCLDGNRAMSKGKLVSLTAFTCVVVNFLVGEQYLSILLPGQIFLPFFKKNKQPQHYLSRTLEDCGTLVNPLVPWGVCATLYSRALQVAPLSYIPYAFFLYLSPLLTLLFGFTSQQYVGEKK